MTSYSATVTACVTVTASDGSTLQYVATIQYADASTNAVVKTEQVTVDAASFPTSDALKQELARVANNTIAAIGNAHAVASATSGAVLTS